MKQTSIEWLFDRFNMLFWFHEGIPDELQEAYEQAKEMHKQEIIDAWEHGQDSFSSRNAEQYYQETFNKD